MSDTMPPDMFLARDESAGYNLALGDPSELFWPFWQETLNGQNIVFEKNSTKYPSINGREELVHLLQRRFPEWNHVVITNGAKQAILAAYYALKESENKFRIVNDGRLYWPSHPTLARMANLIWADGSAPTSTSISLVTTPGNPFTYPHDVGQTYDIWDAVYASTPYGWDKLAPKARIRIGGAAKELGVPGLRVGWLLTNDPKLAELAKQYVEFTTSGVSNYSQLLAVECLRDIENFPFVWEAHCKDVRRKIMENRSVLDVELAEFLSDQEMSTSGMFTYITFEDPAKAQAALKAANVKFVPGVACGDPTKGAYRVSLGNPESYHQEAIIKLAKELAA